MVKVIEGGNGAAFDLAVNDSTVLDDLGGSGGQVTNTYDVSTNYSVTETLGNGDAVDPAVWETTMSSDCQGSLAAGDEKTCTVTNKRKPKLTVIKVIEGGNGAAFDLAVNDSTVLDDVSGAGGEVTNTYDGRHELRRLRDARQRRRRRPGGLETLDSADCQGSLAAGDEKTCTITNKRKPKLTVVKVIEGGNGAFDLAVNGTTVLDNVSGAGGQVTNTYPSALPTPSPRRSATATPSTRRSGDSFSADCAGRAPRRGEHKTCTITNKRKPKLTVVKVIEGGNGAAFDLPSTATVLDNVSGAGGQVTNTPTVGTSYAVSETLGNGDAVDPAVWDDDAERRLRRQPRGRRREDLHDHEQAQAEADRGQGDRGRQRRLLRPQGQRLDRARQRRRPGGQVTTPTTSAPSYSVTETLGNGDAVDPAVWETTLSGDCSGSLAAGDEKTCTITNKRKPKLTVVKVIEGGNGASFDLAVNDSTVLDNVSGTGGQVTNTYPVGASYSVTETLGNGDAVDPAVWETPSARCPGTPRGGDEETCTITNKRKPG